MNRAILSLLAILSSLLATAAHLPRPTTPAVNACERANQSASPLAPGITCGYRLILLHGSLPPDVCGDFTRGSGTKQVVCPCSRSGMGRDCKCAPACCTCDECCFCPVPGKNCKVVPCCGK